MTTGKQPIEIEIAPVWRIRHRGEQKFDAVLVALLRAIGETGRLTDAARHAGISYRHAWNVIEKWGSFLGSPLVSRARGRGTRLTPLGENLLWAAQRVEARLAPQFESLSAELTQTLNETLTAAGPALRLHASHDYFLILRTEMLEHATVREILAFLRSEAFRRAVASLAGYAAERAGDVATIQEALPWDETRAMESAAADAGT